MRLSLKLIWMAVIFLNITSIIWFLLGATANFQRTIDLVSTITFIVVWIPSLALTIVSIRLLAKGWSPSNGIGYVILFSGLILLLYLSFHLFQNVNTEGWLTERVRSDTLKVTSDEKYEYRIDLINLFQRNSDARLYIKDVITGEEINMQIDIYTNKIVGISIGKDNNWVIMEPSDLPGRYILYTTDALKIPVEKFEIDIKQRIVRRLE